MSYTLFDWRYTLPCDKTVHPDVRGSLPEWILELLPRDLDQVRARLSQRWAHLPRPLSSLRTKILKGGKPAIVGRLGGSFVELTLGAQGRDQDWPWVPRTWSTPTKFLPDKAREYLAKVRASTKNELARMPDDHVEHMAYQHVGSQPLFEHYHGDEEMTVYVPPPVTDETIPRGLEKFGFKRDGLLAEFIRAFDGLRESEPGLAGGFIPLREWMTTEQDLKTSQYSWYEHLPADQQREWKDAVIFFHARNGDQVVLHPKQKAGWMLHEEARIESKWPTFEAFIAGYSDALEYRWPFDGYGPSDEAIKARRQREMKKRRPK